MKSSSAVRATGTFQPGAFSLQPAGQPSATSSKRLIGWLVSYALDEKGASFEIRSGRSFISAENTTADTVVSVADASVASPHLALSASPKHRVMIQDIFSESGSYLRRAHEEKEQTINGPVEIRHGDWLRVGERTHFQVVLIDGPSR